MDIEQILADLASGTVRLDHDLASGIAAASRDTATTFGQRIADIKAVSMLAVESLGLLSAWAAASRGAIVEFGPYVGGSTIALLDGAGAGTAVGQQAGRTVIGVDIGGAYLDHPQLPTTDKAADWTRNLERFGHGGCAVLITGRVQYGETAARVRDALDGTAIGLLVIDANGMVWQLIEPYRDLLAPDCLLMVDDYTYLGPSEGAQTNTKFDITRVSVDQGEALGVLERHAVVPWGTWFGRIRPALDEHLDALAQEENERFLALKLAQAVERQGARL
jgi:hypothetical protein